MTYTKTVNGVPIFSPCHTIKVGNKWVSNPTPAQIAQAGWKEYVSPLAERTLESAKQERINLLEAYDQSSDVLSFSLNGVSMWLNPTERTNYLMTVDAAESAGMDAVPFHGTDISISQARTILNAVALYAMRAMAVTDAHRDSINSLKSIQDVDAYDYTANYPDKLIF